MGLKDRFEEILDFVHAVPLFAHETSVEDAADKLLAAVCEEEGHKSIMTHTEQLGEGWLRDHFKCLRCGHVKVGPKGQCPAWTSRGQGG